MADFLQFIDVNAGGFRPKKGQGIAHQKYPCCPENKSVPGSPSVAPAAGEDRASRSDFLHFARPLEAKTWKMQKFSLLAGKLRESQNGGLGLANGGLRYLSTIVLDCLQLSSFCDESSLYKTG